MVYEFNALTNDTRIIQYALNGLNSEISKIYETKEYPAGIVALTEFVKRCVKIEKSLPDIKLEPTIATLVKKHVDGITAKLLNVNQQR